MKLVTMELGGHSPAIVFEYADVNKTLQILSTNKYRNAEQVCVSPIRFLVHGSLYNEFVDGFIEVSKNQIMGNGLDASTTMGPLAYGRRVDAVEEFVLDAVNKGAKIKTGGERKGNKGYI
jgi:succinate-semialdehyde dehydrogenase/glutarate-semialdehyde dehydrogenase